MVRHGRSSRSKQSVASSCGRNVRRCSAIPPGDRSLCRTIARAPRINPQLLTRPQGLAVAPPMRSTRDSQWLHTRDYRAAIAKAVDWLGDRYLLANPIKSHSASPAAARLSRAGVMREQTTGPDEARPLSGDESDTRFPVSIASAIRGGTLVATLEHDYWNKNRQPCRTCGRAPGRHVS